MNHFLAEIYNRLTEEDKRQLSRIYEPTVVACPDDNAWKGLVAMRDGRIRFYGNDCRKSIFDDGGVRCYRESCDGGLSWKKHVVEDPGALGESAYIPFLDKYMAACAAVDIPSGTHGGSAGRTGICVKIGDSPDDADYVVRKVTDRDDLLDLKLPMALQSRNRILFLAHERRPDRHPTCYYPVLYLSDDGGGTWREVRLDEVPYYVKQWPDRGMRWQQNNRENTIVELSNGTLYMMARTALDYHYESFSRDGGDTWTEFRKSVFHSTGTMPLLERLSDGRIVLFWCNTKMMPELPEADGEWEDVFTNRDVNHCAVSEDQGKTWRGYREMFLNPIRSSPDFRSNGGPKEADKSVHQFEALELPMNKLLVAFGQHEPGRRIVLLDMDWLYEHRREENLVEGFRNLSTQNYVRSILGAFRARPDCPLDFAGHCAYNRTSVTLLMPSPEGNGKEALHITRSGDERLVSGIGGAVWNFPIHHRGIVRIRAWIPGKGLRVSLLDYWMNPEDDTVAYFANYSIVLRKDMHDGGIFTEFEFAFDCHRGNVLLTAGEYLRIEKKLDGQCPNGLCYLHLQSAATEEDKEGAYVAGMSFEGSVSRAGTGPE